MNFVAVVDYTLIMEQLLTGGVIMHYNLQWGGEKKERRVPGWNSDCFVKLHSG